MIAITLAVFAVLIAFNGLYVAAEFSAVRVRPTRVRQLAEEGNTFARALLPTLQEPQRLDRYIAACQVGITISSLVLGAYGQASLGVALTPLFQAWGGMQAAAAQSASVAVVLIALTTLQMVLGELVPKSLALQHPTRLALLTVVPMRWSQKLLAWFIVILNGSAWLVLRLLGVEQKAHRHLHSAEEIRYMVAESGEGGQLRPAEQRRLNRALGLSRRTARELMVPRTRMVAVDRNAGVGPALEAAANLPYTRLPVYEESRDKVVGLVHAKDLAATALSDDATPDDSLVPYVRPILAVHESVSADRVLTLMREERGVMALVVDDFGGTSGIITTEDILRQLLGYVADEFQQAGKVPERLSDGRVRIPAEMLLDEAEPWVGTLWQGAADTVGGLIMETLGRIPRRGDTLEIDGVSVEVETVERNTVVTVIATPPGGMDAEGPA